MKEINDAKTNEVNKELEDRLSKERDEWKEKLISLIESIKDTRKLSEAQVLQLSYRQIIQDKLAEYRILNEKIQEKFDKQCTQRFREYALNYDIKLSSSEKAAFIQSDCAALKFQTKMLSTQITYLEETTRTLDNLGFAIKNKIEILSQQLF